jgi:3-hydroxyisobutyrate dehydrogenase-like beta-hydroxyacid dehydrogenase
LHEESKPIRLPEPATGFVKPANCCILTLLKMLYGGIMPNVTVVGTGAMGSALARCLLKNGYDVTVWNRTADKTAPLVAEGADRADTLEQAVAASPLVLTCVKNNSTTLEMLQPLGAALSGKTVFDVSTGDAVEAVALVDGLNVLGADFIIGMINAYPADIGKGTTAILTACGPETWEAYRDVVLQLGGASQRIGAEPGSLAALFAALFTARQGFMLGMIHGALVCRKAEVPLQVFSDQLPVSLKLMQDYYHMFARTVPAGNYDNPGASLAVYTDAMDNALATFKSTGAPAALPQLIHDLAHDAVRGGYGDKELTAVYEHLLKDS